MANEGEGMGGLGRSASLGQEEEELLVSVDEAYGEVGEKADRDMKILESENSSKGESRGAGNTNESIGRGEGLDPSQGLEPGGVDGLEEDGRDGSGGDENAPNKVGKGHVDDDEDCDDESGRSNVEDARNADGDSDGGEEGGGGDERREDDGDDDEGVDEVHEALTVGRRERRRSRESFSMEVKRRASAWYYVSYHPDWLKKRPVDMEGGEGVEEKGVRPVLLSFPWVGDTVLAAIKEERTRERQVHVEK